ncbi:MAG TPA: alpha amylase C-terminal domain-containing protein [Roseomonas sp.]|nr:alpha amylase C-terminal domain-containing protein [Roseomonas sp.]
MPASQAHLSGGTPLGANLAADGATFRAWAPRALAVHVIGTFGGKDDWQPHEGNRLVRDDNGYWAGFVPGARDGDPYMFHVAGQGSAGRKRDPYARELSRQPAYPECNCILRDSWSYPWHDGGYRPPAFNDLVIYQLHVGTFAGRDRRQRAGTFLEVLDRLDHLLALGVNAVQLLPIGEFASIRSRGYDGSDLFSPEMDYGLDAGELGPHLGRVNALLARRGQAPLGFDQLAPPVNQLKALVDILHLHGIAVLLDVVHNHAGFQIDGQPESIYFFDRAAGTNPNDSLYFTEQEHIGGPVFAFWRQEVRQFLIDNACFFLKEYHVDGMRYDRVDVILQDGGQDGVRYCQDLARSTGFVAPGGIQIAEHWPPDPWLVRPVAEGGAGFHALWHDSLRYALRGAVSAASLGRDAAVGLGGIAWSLDPAGHQGLPAAWRAVQFIESHDEAYKDKGPRARIPALADPGNPRSWYAASRARVAAGILLTAPGIPMIFMGQEFLEDKPWGDNPDEDPLIWWEGLDAGDKTMSDYLRFFQELVRLRRRHPALRGERVNAFHVNEADRVLAYHRWLEGSGRDVVVVASFREETLYGYQLGMPRPGRWLEAFNADVYQNWVNPALAGNGGQVWADGAPLHGLPQSASLVIPANGLIVLTMDGGDF